jgi:hypothetical protein
MVFGLRRDEKMIKIFVKCAATLHVLGCSYAFGFIKENGQNGSALTFD